MAFCRLQGGDGLPPSQPSRCLISLAQPRWPPDSVSAGGTHHDGREEESGLRGSVLLGTTLPWDGRAGLHRESGVQGKELHCCPPGHLGMLLGGDVLGVSPVLWQLLPQIVDD